MSCCINLKTHQNDATYGTTLFPNYHIEPHLSLNVAINLSTFQKMIETMDRGFMASAFVPQTLSFHETYHNVEKSCLGNIKNKTSEHRSWGSSTSPKEASSRTPTK